MTVVSGLKEGVSSNALSYALSVGDYPPNDFEKVLID